MTFASLGEEFVSDGAFSGWIPLGAMRCDFCGAEVRGELGDLDLAVHLDGWTNDRALDRAMCPDCRRHASASDSDRR